MITDVASLSEIPKRLPCKLLTRAQAEEWPGRVWHYKGQDIGGRPWELWYGELSQDNKPPV